MGGVVLTGPPDEGHILCMCGFLGCHTTRLIISYTQSTLVSGLTQPCSRLYPTAPQPASVQAPNQPTTLLSEEEGSGPADHGGKGGGAGYASGRKVGQ